MSEFQNMDFEETSRNIDSYINQITSGEVDKALLEDTLFGLFKHLYNLMDWGYDYSDDHSVWSEGKSRFDIIDSINQKLFDIYNWNFSSRIVERQN